MAADSVSGGEQGGGGIASVGAIAAAFLKLGCISFGGPIAHLGFLRAEFVERRRWLSDEEYADLVALCQFLPGPASSQAVFALGMRRGGIAGALAASFCFTMPSAVAMIAFASGLAALGGEGAGWLHGLKVAAVAVVAQAVWGMGRRLCPDAPRLAMAAAAAGALVAFPGGLLQAGVIATGAAIGWAVYRRSIPPVPSDTPTGGHGLAAAALAIWALLLAAVPAAAARTADRWIDSFDAFYRAGSLVFGGGHVVLPLLRAEVVPTGWIGDDTFLAGYAAAQAVPGPLFTFAAYLGAAMPGDWNAWAMGLWCLGAIMLPAWLLIGGALPFWHRLRGMAGAQAALRGANAAVVGVLAAALASPILPEGIRSLGDAAAAAAALALLEGAKAPPWAVVAACAAYGAAAG